MSYELSLRLSRQIVDKEIALAVLCCIMPFHRVSELGQTERAGSSALLHHAVSSGERMTDRPRWQYASDCGQTDKSNWQYSCSYHLVSDDGRTDRVGSTLLDHAI